VVTGTVAPLSEITLAILAGGEGSRMGAPKGLLRIAGRPILEYLLDQFAWPGPTMLVTAPGREHPPAWERFGRECVDPIAGLGPLRGVLTSLENTTTEWVAVATVDMPAIGRERIETLAAAVQAGDLGAMFRRFVPGGDEMRVEPFPLLVAKGAAAAMRSRMRAGALSVVRLLDEPEFAVCDAPQAWGDAVWANLNRPADLASFLART
jgi:molybdopterin-guanine dinucleotide biosynthesis protein A